VYLLDTNHCSGLIDKNPAIIGKLKLLGNTPVATCAIVRGELRYMVEKSVRRLENEEKVKNFLNDIEVLTIGNAVADQYGAMKAKIFTAHGPKSKRHPRKMKMRDFGIDDNDLWIAATAIENGLIVVSEDGGYQKIKEACQDLQIENWLSS
jgi:tRNA(fMet)-specific endonuclease VapC